MFRCKSFVKLKLNGLLVLCLYLAAFPQQTQALLYSGCDNTYELSPGYAYLMSPYYPKNYPAGSSCRYKFVAPLDYEIQIDCTIYAPRKCSTEFFYVARDGDVQLRGSEEICGTGNFTRTSLFRDIVISYISYGNTGSFRCRLYAKPQACDCGWSVNSLIVNGEQTGVNEYPSMAALQDKTMNLPSFCAATIISHRYLVTAAHCTRVQTVASNLRALVGEHNLASATESRYAAWYDIQRIIEHPSYDENSNVNDIALLQTYYNIEWSRGVGPICLPPSNRATNAFAYQYADVIGWGTTSFAGPVSNTLQKVSLMIIENTNCQSVYNGIATIYNTHMCTYDYTGKSHDSCQYDSGGPVILRHARQFLLGCITFGKICGEGGYAVGINTRITAYLTWIAQNSENTACPRALG